MKTCCYTLTLLLLLLVIPGCSPDKEKGMHSPNQQKDMPRAAPEEKGK